MSKEPRLFECVRDRIRVKRLSIRTEQAYLHWIKRYILFHRKRHPQEMGVRERSRRSLPISPQHGP